jgi:NTP pyrophosphatase (non-canonical NTP hydrolase)
MTIRSLSVLALHLREFAAERDWDRFHTPKNLAAALSVEAAELLEHFQWKDKTQSERHAAENKQAVAEEIADVAIYLLELADNLGIDLEKAINEKLDKNAQKYPVEKARGVAKKYTEL